MGGEHIPRSVAIYSVSIAFDYSTKLNFLRASPPASLKKCLLLGWPSEHMSAPMRMAATAAHRNNLVSTTIKIQQVLESNMTLELLVSFDRPQVLD